MPLLEDSVSKMLNVEKAVISIAANALPEAKNGKIIIDPRFLIPLVVEHNLLGVLNVYGKAGGAAFGSGDIHLMAALSDFVAAIIEHADHYRHEIRSIAYRDSLPESLPCGVISADSEGRIAFFNAAAGRILRLDPAIMLRQKISTLPDEIAEGLERAAAKKEIYKRGVFYLEKYNSFIGGSISPLFNDTGETIGAAIIFAELGGIERCEALMGALEREIKRSNRYGRTTTVVIFAVQGGLNRLLALIDAVRGCLRKCDICGRYERDKFALILPETHDEGASALLFRIRSILEKGDCDVGVATSPDDGKTAEQLIEKACERMARISTIAKRTILSLDNRSVVNDVIELIFNTDYHVVKSTSVNDTLGYIEKSRTDGLIAEYDIAGDLDGPRLVQRAKNIRPGIKAFLTSTITTAEKAKTALSSGALALLEKPFDVDEIQRVVHEAVSR